MIRRLGKKKAEALALAGKPWPRSSITASRKAPRRNTKKKWANFKRQFLSEQRVLFIKSLPCAACGVVGYSENAHLTPKSEKGTGYRGGYRFIAPLCGWRPDVDAFYGRPGTYIGCHRLYDMARYQFDACFPDFDATGAATECEMAWREFLTGESK